MNSAEIFKLVKGTILLTGAVAIPYCYLTY